MNTKFDQLLSFPCAFPFKVLGVSNPDLVHKISAVLDALSTEYSDIKSKTSAQGNYQSVTVRVQANSKEHLETLYETLGEIDIVRYVL